MWVRFLIQYCMANRNLRANPYQTKNADGAASCRCATRPVPSTRPGHPPGFAGRPSRALPSMRIVATALVMIALQCPHTQSVIAEEPAKSTAANRQQHWSFRPMVAPVEPDVGNPGWVKTPVDRFILSKLERAG